MWGFPSVSLQKQYSTLQSESLATLRVADAKLDCEKLQRAMFEGLLFQVLCYQILIKSYDSNFEWINRFHCLETDLFIDCVYHYQIETIDWSPQVFDQMSKCLVCVWDTLTMGCTHYDFEGVSFGASKGLHRVFIKLVIMHTFTSMLHWISLMFIIYGKLITDAVIKGRILVRIYVVYSLDT